MNLCFYFWIFFLVINYALKLSYVRLIIEFLFDYLNIIFLISSSHLLSFPRACCEELNDRKRGQVFFEGMNGLYP